MIEIDIPGLVYTEEPHAYSYNGVPQPYVSGILKDLGLTEDLSRVDPVRLEYKTQIGKASHLAIKFFSKGTLDLTSVHQDIAPYFNSFQKCLKATGAKIIASEVPIISLVRGFCCTIDSVWILNDQVVLVDYKTSTALSKSVEYQLWFQELAWNEWKKDMPIQKRFSLHLKPNERYSLDPWNARSASNADNLLFTWKELRTKGKTHV